MNKIKQVLQMTFISELGKKVTLSIDNPREDIVASEIKDAMLAVVASGAIQAHLTDGVEYKLVAIDSARIVETTTSGWEM